MSATPTLPPAPDPALSLAPEATPEPAPALARGPDPAPGYQVLARKYRPATFADLIGQEAMVRTLRNAFAADRIAHAFILTGVRGVGKTTTARIVAKGLNCTGPDGRGGPTTEPCGVCEACRAITQGRHVDVLEMDGASQTRIDDIRANVLDSVHYAPASARYKVYIIDEVHMLSTSAFNALLKTLEEPPPHVKFIFATTEIRKVPVTILSRCQRFDLRRIEPEAMMAHLARIAEAEGARVAPGALALITRAAEGSVRDAMSLMDQAIAHGAAAGGETSAAEVRAMLGLADRGRVLDLFDLVMRGDAAGALGELAGQYADGADPLAVLRDLAEVTHWISVVKITPEAADDPATPPEERVRGTDMARRLPMRALSRAWQMLLKALEETGQAPNAMMAAEMAVIRLTHMADLPDPETLIRRLQGGPAAAAAPPMPPAAPARPPQPSAGPGAGAAPPPAPHLPPARRRVSLRVIRRPVAGPIRRPPVLRPRRWRRAHSAARAGPRPCRRTACPTATRRRPTCRNRAREDAPPDAVGTFAQVLDLIRARRDVALLMEVETTLRPVRCAPGRIEFEPTADAAPDLASRLAQRLQAWTGQRWGVSVVGSGGASTVAEARGRAADGARAEALDNPLVQAVLAAFPDARIDAVRDPRARQDAAPEGPEAARPEAEPDGGMGPVRGRLTLRAPWPRPRSGAGRDGWIATGGDGDAEGTGQHRRHGQDDEGRAGHAGQARRGAGRAGPHRGGGRVRRRPRACTRDRQGRPLRA